MYLCLNVNCFCVGAASKRFGIDEEREAVPLTLSVAYNKVLFQLWHPPTNCNKNDNNTMDCAY